MKFLPQTYWVGNGIFCSRFGRIEETDKNCNYSFICWWSENLKIVSVIFRAESSMVPVSKMWAFDILNEGNRNDFWTFVVIVFLLIEYPHN